MGIVYEMTPFKFVRHVALEELVTKIVASGQSTVEEVIDRCRAEGFDARATASEIGIQLADGVIRKASDGPLNMGAVLMARD